MSAAVHGPGEVIAFWFSDRVRPLWFEKNPEFDAEIRRRFEATHEAAAAGRLDGWERDADGALALLLLLDQFPRNMYRGSPRAFATDARARAIADRAVARGLDRAVPADRRHFFYLPFEHSEDIADQRRGVALFRALVEAQSGSGRAAAEEQLKWAERHLEVIERFGRFPHRNAILGRETTEEEAVFLTQPMSSF